MTSHVLPSEDNGIKNPTYKYKKITIKIGDNDLNLDEFNIFKQIINENKIKILFFEYNKFFSD
jgi:hypothetical protein